MAARKATPYQLAVLSEFMRHHPVLASGHYGKGLQAKIQADKLWRELANQLHAVSGPTKSIAKWKQTWRDLRLSLKKTRCLQREGRGTDMDSGHSHLEPLSATKEQVLNTVVPVAFTGIEGGPNAESESKPSMEVLFTSDSNLHNTEEDFTIFTASPATPTARSSSPAPPGSRKSIIKKMITNRRAFAQRLLKLEEEKIAVKRAHYATMQKIEKDKLTAQKDHYAALQEIELKKADGIRGIADALKNLKQI